MEMHCNFSLQMNKRWIFVSWRSGKTVSRSNGLVPNIKHLWFATRQFSKFFPKDCLLHTRRLPPARFKKKTGHIAAITYNDLWFVRSNPLALEFIDWHLQNETLCLAAVKKSYRAFYYVCASSEAICYEYLEYMYDMRGELFPPPDRYLFPVTLPPNRYFWPPRPLRLTLQYHNINPDSVGQSPLHDQFIKQQQCNLIFFHKARGRLLSQKQSVLFASFHYVTPLLIIVSEYLG